MWPGPSGIFIHAFFGGAGSRSNTIFTWAEAYLRTKWHLDPPSRLATIDMGGKVGMLCPHFGEGELGPHLTQRRLDRLDVMQVGLGPGHIVLDGDPGPLPPKGQSPQFLAHMCCSQMARWIKMPLRRTVSLDPSDIVLDGDPASPHPKGEQSPQFSAHVYCSQTAAWIKMPLGMEVGLGSGHIVLDGDPAPSPRKMGHSCPILANFYCVQTAGWIKMPLGMEVDLGPGRIVLHWDPAPPHKTGTGPQFSTHVYCGQTVAHLSYC